MVMQFWNEMISKYGFSDGAAVPPGAEVYRSVYIRTVNKLAEQLGSSVRAVAYDRPGVHNWCMILFYNASDLRAFTPEQLTQPVEVGAAAVDADAMMAKAVNQADDLEIDDFVEVQVDVDERFEAFVTGLQPTG